MYNMVVYMYMSKHRDDVDRLRDLVLRPTVIAQFQRHLRRSIGTLHW